MPARKEETVRAVEDTAAVSLPIDGAVGLGVDIVEIARMKKILERTPSFARKVFSCEECCYCEDTAAPEVHFATRFAAKEAVVKALGTGFTRGIGVRDIEVKRSSKGRPYVVLSGRAKQVAKELGVRELPISLSYTHTDAVACALAITEDSQKAAEERVDQKAELARSALRKRARCLTRSTPPPMRRRLARRPLRPRTSSPRRPLRPRTSSRLPRARPARRRPRGWGSPAGFGRLARECGFSRSTFSFR